MRTSVWQFISYQELSSHLRMAEKMLLYLFLKIFWRISGMPCASFAKIPGFTLTAMLTLALGIGATTAISVLCMLVLLRSLTCFIRCSRSIPDLCSRQHCLDGGLHCSQLRSRMASFTVGTHEPCAIS